MNPRFCLLLAVAACALPSCGKNSWVQRANSADIGNSPTAPSLKTGNVAGDLQDVAPPVTPSAQGFANAAAASDNFEIQTSRLALTNGGSPAVKDFARKMIDAHTRSTAALEKAASAAAPPITPDKALGRNQQLTLDQLRARKGADFDVQYVSIQRDAHQRALDALKNYAAKGNQPSLNAFANEMIPVVSRHLIMARALQAGPPR